MTTKIKSIKISKKLESLAVKAKKYKSANEFVKRQKVIYHGGAIDDISDIKFDESYLGVRTQDIKGQNGDPIREFGVNFATDKDIAKSFSRTGYILEAYFFPVNIKKYKTDNELLNNMLNIAYKNSGSEHWLEAKKIRDIAKKNEYMIDNIFNTGIVKEIKDDLLEKGFDSIQFRNTLDGGTTIIPLKKEVLKTKFQLIDIWK